MKREHDERMNAPIPFIYQIRTVLFPRIVTINWLLLLSPVGFTLAYTHIGAIPTFIINFLAIFPFAAILLLVIPIILLKSKSPVQITIMKASLIGSIVSNLHLLLGLGFLIGGRNYYNQNFNSSTAATCGMLLLLATKGLMVPTISSLESKVSADSIWKLSRGTAIMLLSSYGLFIFSRLKSHSNWFQERAQLSVKRKLQAKREGEALKALAIAGGGAAATAGGFKMLDKIAFVEPDKEPEIPQLSPLGIGCTLVLSTLLLAFHTDFTTNNFTAITGDLTSAFIGMALLPLFAIDPGCVTMSAKDQQDINVDNTLGKCIQVALVLTPSMVILAWILEIPEMTLLFTNFEIGTLFLSVIIMNYITSNGKSNW